MPSDNSTYVKNLLMRRHGYPLWIPEPNYLSFEHHSDGVQIGDVGIITNDGCFDFLFNVFLAADHPVHHRPPPLFTRLDENALEIRKVDNIHPTGSHISHAVHRSNQIRAGGSVSAETMQVVSPVTLKLALTDTDSLHSMVPVGLEGSFRFSSTCSEGAVLILPDGAARTDLYNIKVLRDLAENNASSWYEFARGSAGRDAPDGSLYLVTGFDKATRWGVSSIYSPSSTSGDVTVKFTFLSAGSIEGSCEWTSAIEHSVGHRIGPGRRSEGALRQDQCVFLRGFKIFSKKFGRPKPFSKRSKVLSTADANIADLLFTQKTPSVPYSGRISLSGSFRGTQDGTPKEEEEHEFLVTEEV